MCVCVFVRGISKPDLLSRIFLRVPDVHMV